MSKITFSEQAWEEYLYWQENEKKILKKINKLLKEIQRTPFSGEGKPEPLKWSPDSWSRRINKAAQFFTKINVKNVLFFVYFFL